MGSGIDTTLIWVRLAVLRSLQSCSSRFVFGFANNKRYASAVIIQNSIKGIIISIEPSPPSGESQTCFRLPIQAENAKELFRPFDIR